MANLNRIPPPLPSIPPRSTPKKTNSLRITIYTVLAVFIAWTFLIQFLVRDKQEDNVKWSPSVETKHIMNEQVETSLVGDKIGNAPNKVALVTVDEATLRSMMETLGRKDVDGFFRFIQAEKATLLPDGTKVRVITRKTLPGTTATVAQIQVLEGELSGRTLWTSAVFLP